MYETSFSISKYKNNWLVGEQKLKQQISKINGLLAIEPKYDRILFALAAEDQYADQLDAIVYQFVCDCFLVGAKSEYIQKNLNLKIDSYDILLKILVEFDRESEREILEKLLSPTKELSIDGYFYFRLQKLQERWDEICALAKENAFFLTNRETVFELMRFLMSTIKPKIEKLSVCVRDGVYQVFDFEGAKLEEFDTAEGLMAYFIETAPLQISLLGDILPPRQKLLLESIFEDKLVDA